MPSASFTASRSYVRRSRRKGANRIPTPSRTTSGKHISLSGNYYMRPYYCKPNGFVLNKTISFEIGESCLKVLSVGWKTIFVVCLFARFVNSNVIP